jgi:two-component system NarL family sensor kinase
MALAKRFRLFLDSVCIFAHKRNVPARMQPLSGKRVETVRFAIYDRISRESNGMASSRSSSRSAITNGSVRIQAALDPFDTHMAAILDNMNECFFAIDSDGYISDVNRQAAAWLGADVAKLRGQHYANVPAARNDADIRAALASVLEAGEVSIMERQFRTWPNRWLELRAYPWNGGINVFFRDVSDQKAAETETGVSHALLQAAMSAMASQIAVLDTKGSIVFANSAWGRCGMPGGIAEQHRRIGGNYLLACEAAAATCCDAKRIGNGLRSVLSGAVPEFKSEYSRSRDRTKLWFRVHITHCKTSSAAYIVVLHEDISLLKRTEKEFRQFPGKLLAAQDAAQRRVARELHDTTAQHLLCASFAVDRTSSLLQDAPQARACLTEAAELISASQAEIRTLAYLLHPPMLDEAGLSTALRWFVSGFIKRSRLDITLDVDPDLETWPLSLEIRTALFRVTQEALTNVHRHSGSQSAGITLALVRGAKSLRVKLEITDDGSGVPPNVKVGQGGVGLMGMSERMKQVGGNVTVRRRDKRGTIVSASVPVPLYIPETISRLHWS